MKSCFLFSLMMCSVSAPSFTHCMNGMQESLLKFQSEEENEYQDEPDLVSLNKPIKKNSLNQSTNYQSLSETDDTNETKPSLFERLRRKLSADKKDALLSTSTAGKK